MCYCLGVLEMFDGIYDVSTVKMVIYQPRRENVSEYTMSKADLLRWADEVLAPIAKLALEGKGEFKAGEHCRFCKVKATCRKRAEYNLEAAKCDFEMPAELEDYEMSWLTLYVQPMSNAVALCGLYDGPLETYLNENPHIRRIVLCLDADRPGREAAVKLGAKYRALGHEVEIRFPPFGKDWNEYLQMLGPPPAGGGYWQIETVGK